MSENRDSLPAMTIRDFRGTSVYVVGGSSGIGLAVAKILAGKGAHIVLFSRSEDKLQKALDDVKQAARGDDQRFGYKPLDVAKHNDVVEIMRRASGRFLAVKPGRAQTLFGELRGCPSPLWSGDSVDLWT